MESYKCKFCFQSFSNGRALGGHMRSHMPNLHKFSVLEEEQEEERPSQLSDETESDVSSSSSSEQEEEEERNGFILEDGEIETSIVNLTRKRSKRTRKIDSFATKKIKTSQLGYKTEPETEPETEPLHSSASDTTTEEDLAFCLMMLSRDKWKKKNNKEETKAEESEGYNDKSSKIITTKGRYKCETCGKMFKSYQALGGHRASHKKNRVLNNKIEQDNVVLVTEKRIHECPICLRVFASGQALGGHKRSHGIGNLSVNRCYNNNQVQRNERMIDLNLPAPNEEEEVSVVFQ